MYNNQEKIFECNQFYSMEIVFFVNPMRILDSLITIKEKYDLRLKKRKKKQRSIIIKLYVYIFFTEGRGGFIYCKIISILVSHVQVSGFEFQFLNYFYCILSTYKFKTMEQ